jgi:hypothetical protein
MTGRKKQEIITFKVDKTLVTAMEGIENRSEFIRSAILSALQNICPLCKGTGMLTPDQYRHWNEFAQNHSVEECSRCNAYYIVCELENSRIEHP